MEELKTIFQFINTVASLGGSSAPQRREPQAYVIKTGAKKKVKRANVAAEVEFEIGGEPVNVKLFFSMHRGGRHGHRKAGEAGGGSENAQE